ncbi:MAG: ATP-binding cassette domain-containing protein [Firmicutes bacterium]|nr:ATP-binding cassette domain-containing protein [Bacillota bacterium]
MALELKDISYSNILNNISFKINEGDNLSIIGNIASGKTSLCNILNNRLKYNGSYLINDEVVNKTIVNNNVILINNCYLYDNDKVVDIFFDEINDEDKIKKIVKTFNIDRLLNIRLEELNKADRYYILIILALLSNKKYIVIDDILCNLRKKYIENIYKYAKKNKISIINVASTLDNVLYSDYVIFLYKSKIAMEGNVIDTLKEEKLIKRLGYRLPFMYDLSLQLNYYEVLDDIIIDREKMVDKIWK